MAFTVDTILGGTATARQRSIAAIGCTPSFSLSPACCVLDLLYADRDIRTAERLADYWRVASECQASSFCRGRAMESDLDLWLDQMGKRLAGSGTGKAYIGLILAIESLMIFGGEKRAPAKMGELEAALEQLVGQAGREPKDAELIEAMTFTTFDMVEAMAQADRLAARRRLNTGHMRSGNKLQHRAEH